MVKCILSGKNFVRVWVLSVIVSPVFASTTLDGVLQQSRQVDVSARTSQEKVDALQEAARPLRQEIRALEKELAQLQLNNEHARQVENAQQKKIDQVSRDIAAVSETEVALTPYLLSLIQWLEQHVQQDLPFHAAERQARIDQLKTYMIDPDLSVAERYRRIVEAYQIESEFGYTQEVYPQTIEVNGQASRVTIFRLGRVALYYVSLDQQQAGFWDPSSNQWTALPGSYLVELQKAIKIAGKQAPASLLVLPIKGGQH